MYALIQNNEIVKTAGNARAFFTNTSFPAGGPSAQFLADNGVVAVVDGEQKDQRFYWVTPAQPAIQLVNGVPTRLYVNTAKELDQLKEQWIAQVKENANKELAPTDWYVIRKAERDVAIPEEVVAERQAIIDACTSKEAAITAATTVEELKEALFPVTGAEQQQVDIGNIEDNVTGDPNVEEVTGGTLTGNQDDIVIDVVGNTD